MVSKTTCRRCGRLGNFNDVKLYPLPHDPSQSMFLCEACYRKILFEKNREKVQTRTCHQCGRNIPVDARLCPYCGVPLRSDSLRSSRHSEMMCGFCGARFIGNPTVCPSCGKRIRHVPDNQDLTWVEGEHVTKNMLLIVFIIVGVVVVAILLHLFMNSFSVTNVVSVGVEDTFKVVNCRVINHNGQAALHVFFNANIGGEIRVSGADHVVGRTMFSSADTEKIIDLRNITWYTLGSTQYSMVVICRNKEIFSQSYTFGVPSFMINEVKIIWAIENKTLNDVLSNVMINVSLGGDTDLVNIAEMNVVIDDVNGPFSKSFEGNDQWIFPGDVKSITVHLDLPAVPHREIHLVSIVLLDSYNHVLREYVGDFQT